MSIFEILGHLSPGYRQSIEWFLFGMIVKFMVALATWKKPDVRNAFLAWGAWSLAAAAFVLAMAGIN